MKKQKVYFLLLLTCTSCSTAPMDTLRKHMNCDLRACPLSDAGDVVRAALLATGGTPHLPLYLTQMATDAGTNLVVYIENEPIDDFSGGDKAVRVSVLAPEECRCSLPMFWIGGSQTTLKGISVMRAGGTGAAGDILVVQTSSGMADTTTRQFYALSTLEWPWCLSLVRLEDANGHPFFEDYSPHNGHWVARIGPMVAGCESAQEWIERLDRGSTAQVLSTLFFLCSDHSNRDEKEYPGVAEQIPQALSLLSREKASVLKNLSKHENAWIREYVQILRNKTAETAIMP